MKARWQRLLDKTPRHRQLVAVLLKDGSIHAAIFFRTWRTKIKAPFMAPKWEFISQSNGGVLAGVSYWLALTTSRLPMWRKYMDGRIQRFDGWPNNANRTSDKRI